MTGFIDGILEEVVYFLDVHILGWPVKDCVGAGMSDSDVHFWQRRPSWSQVLTRSLPWWGQNCQ